MEHFMTATSEGTQRDARTNGRRGVFVAGETEARPGVMTTEFWLTILSAMTVVIATYVSDSLSSDVGWALFAGIIAAYAPQSRSREGRLPRGALRARRCESTRDRLTLGGSPVSQLRTPGLGPGVLRVRSMPNDAAAKRRPACSHRRVVYDPTLRGKPWS